MRKDRRSRLLTNRFQSTLLVRIVVYWALFQLTMWNFLFLWQLVGEGRGSLLDQYARFFRDHYQMLYCLVILVPVFAWDALRMSHRVVGPINRMQQTIRAVTEGRAVSRIKLRSGDHLTEIVADLNAMLEALEERGVVKLNPGADKASEFDLAGSAVGSDENDEGACHDQSYS